MNNKKSIQKVEKYTLLNNFLIECINCKKTINYIESEFTCSDSNEEYIEELLNDIFNNLEIDPSIINDPDEKKRAEFVIKSMNQEFYKKIQGSKNKFKNFSLSEIVIPIILSNEHNFSWIWWNQCFNYDSNSAKPATGMDSVFVFREELIFAEIKSAQNEKTILSNIKNSIISLDKYQNEVNRLPIICKLKKYQSKFSNIREIIEKKERFF